MRVSTPFSLQIARAYAQQHPKPERLCEHQGNDRDGTLAERGIWWIGSGMAAQEQRPDSYIVNIRVHRQPVLAQAGTAGGTHDPYTYTLKGIFSAYQSVESTSGIHRPFD